MAEATIDQLLSVRHARRLGTSGSPALARAHLPLNRLLWSQYETYRQLHFAFSRREIRLSRLTVRQHRIIRSLERAGILIRDNNHLRIRSSNAKRYLAGRWLEELAYCAILQSGADEAYYAQAIGWKGDGAAGVNVIDVVARRGSILSFVSCRTASPFYRRNRRASERHDNRLFNDHYWPQHFGPGDARAILITTADLLEEPRSGSGEEILSSRAAVLDVDMVGRNQFTWEGLVEVMRNHW